MLKLRKRNYVRISFRIFLLCLVAALAVFTVRVITGSEITAMSIGQMLFYAEEYSIGKIYDRNGDVIVSGNSDSLIWDSDVTAEAFQAILGTDVESTLLSRSTLLGNCPWLFGTEDNRWGLDFLLHPGQERVGGSVQLTLDKNLQEYIRNLVIQSGYENAYVLVSDYTTGEILSVYGSVFTTELHPGSTLKPLLAATILTLDSSLVDYTYNCTDENHNFQTEDDGLVRINCAGKAFHGQISMEEAIAYSCNGYFIGLIQQVDRKEMLEALQKWGFDTIVSYDQFMYLDHSFVKDSESETDYLMASIGQANAYITPAGLHFCTSAILNHGKLIEPIWYTRKQSAYGQSWEDVVDQETKMLCKASVAEQVTAMMEQVTVKGTGTSFYLPGFAAKTGTAQKADETGNMTDLYTVWTTGGLTNSENPYSVTVCLDNVTEEVGSEEAGKLAQYILMYLTEGGE